MAADSAKETMMDGERCVRGAGGGGCSPMEVADAARVMTLATGSSMGCWSSPIYFVFRTGLFYFFSSPDSRHVREGMDSFCGASIFMDSRQAENIRGLQMEGRLDKAGTTGELSGAAAAYVGKYGLTFSGSDALAFLKGHYRAKFYCFIPETIYYMDNRSALGSREKVTL